MKRALVLGAAGQDGSFLCDILLEKGYEVHGMVRRTSHDNLGRIKHLEGKIVLHWGDVTDPVSLAECGLAFQNDRSGYDFYSEVYNMADQDQIRYSHFSPVHQIQVTYVAVAMLLEMFRGTSVKFFQPVSATMFGACLARPFYDGVYPLDERSPLAPASPYACAKAAAWHLCRHYRREHKIHVCCGIMFNHDSERRRDGYLLQKIARAAAANQSIALGDLSHKVDIGYAREYMEAVHDMMQLDEPDDFVVATSRPISIQQIVEAAERASDWRYGNPDPNAIGYPQTLHPVLIGDSFKLLRATGWEAGHNATSLVQKIIFKRSER